MSIMLMASIGVILFIGIVLFIIMRIGWGIHVDMVREYTYLYGWGDYEKFINEFNKYNWCNRYKYGTYDSLWDIENNCEIHASIIKFNDVGMMMKTPIEWIKVNLFLIDRYNKSKNVNLYDWK